MTNEKMLKILNEYFESKSFSKLVDLKDGLEDNIRKEVSKSKGNANKYSLLKKLFKGKEYQKFHEAFIPYNNKLKAYTDGFRMYFLKDDYRYKQLNGSEDLAKNIVPKDIEEYIHEIEVDINDLKSFVSINKHQKTPIYILEKNDFKIGFNAIYLLETLQIIGTTKIYCKNSISPAITTLKPSCSGEFSDDDREFAIVLPVRIN